jgi:hypothetical protein
VVEACAILLDCHRRPTRKFLLTATTRAEDRDFLMRLVARHGLGAAPVLRALADKLDSLEQPRSVAQCINLDGRRNARQNRPSHGLVHKG